MAKTARRRDSRALTRADFDLLPEDGRRHELLDGAIVVTPAPGAAHQRMVLGLAVALRECLWNTDLELMLGPFDVVLGDNVVEPDLLVARRSDITERELPGAPVLAVEVRSPGTRWTDEGRKRELYAASSVACYWLVDPVEPAVTVLELIDGAYQTAAIAHGDEAVRVTCPVPMELNPAVLARG